MADIRINSLPTTASASSSDDFLALDGATNGTRKLNAYSPTFGGNLTVSGTGTSTFGGILNVGGSFASPTSANTSLNLNTTTANWEIGRNATAGGFYIYGYGGAGYALKLADATGNATLSGNLTVSGGTATISTALAAGTQTINLSGGASTNGSIIANGATGELRTSFGPSVAWGGFHTWYTDTTERMRLFANGNLGIGTGSTDGGQKLQVNGTAIVSSTTASTTTSSGALVVSGGVGVGGAINAGGAITSNNGSGSGLLGMRSSSGNASYVFWSETGVADRGILGFNNGSSTLSYRSGASSFSTGTEVFSISSGGNVVISGSGGYAVIGGRQWSFRANSSGGSPASGCVIRDDSAAADRLTIDINGDSVFAGSLKTSDPSGGTAAAWKLGTVATVSPTSPNRTIEVDIGGTIYYIHAKTTNN